MFLLDAETAHHLTIRFMSVSSLFLPTHSINKKLRFSRKGILFSSPIGLAAGLDKNAEAINFLSKLPFGFIEVGTVTPKPQVGNDKPRLFRYVELRSIRNRMGFNNHGKDGLLRNIRHAEKNQRLIGVNVGKNKTTTNEDAPKDYEELLRAFDQEVNVDYLVINISSPNTPGLRDLLQDEGLRSIFEVVKKHHFKKPIYLKISPDMSEEEMQNLLRLSSESKIFGIIATNTTVMKEYGEGGMSGRILFEKSKSVRKFLLQELKKYPELHLIGVGGFESFSQIKEFWKDGGDAVQIYSSFIFEGPALLLAIEKEILKDMEAFKAQTFDDYLAKIRA